MDFFTINSRTTPESLRRRYRELCRMHHPDRGGSDAVQAQINVEYQQAMQQLADVAANKGAHATSDRLAWQMERHFDKITEHIRQNRDLYYPLYKELKTPLMKRLIPEKYHGLAEEILKLIVKP